MEPIVADLLSVLRVSRRAIEYCFAEDEDELLSSVLPLPAGEHLVLARIPADGEYQTGGRVWHSAPVICRWLNRFRCTGAVLELGSGTGACGLVAAASADTVTLTDGDARLLSLMARNLAYNRPKLGGSCRVVIQQLTWGAQDALPAGPFDLILGSDVIYDSDTHDQLCTTLRTLLQRDAQHAPAAIFATMPRHRVPAPSRHGELGVTQSSGRVIHQASTSASTSSSGLFSDAALVRFVATARSHGLKVAPLEESDGDVCWSAAGADADEFAPWPRGFAFTMEQFRDLQPFLFAVGLQEGVAAAPTADGRSAS